MNGRIYMLRALGGALMNDQHSLGLESMACYLHVYTGAMVIRVRYLHRYRRSSVL